MCEWKIEKWKEFVCLCICVFRLDVWDLSEVWTLIYSRHFMSYVSPQNPRFCVRAIKWKKLLLNSLFFQEKKFLTASFLICRKLSKDFHLRYQFVFATLWCHLVVLLVLYIGTSVFFIWGFTFWDIFRPYFVFYYCFSTFYQCFQYS